MSQQPSGWYDDPSNPDMLRYWDGVTWSNHTAPRKSPTASASSGGPDYQGHRPSAPSASRQPSQPTQAPPPLPQGSGWQTGTGQNQAPGPLQGYGQGTQHPGTPGYPGGQQYPGAPGSANWMQNRKMTADGVPLASWGKRLGAWVIDGLILLVLAYVATRAFVPTYLDTVQKLLEAIEAGQQSAANTVAQEVASEAAKVGLISWLITTIYCIAFWTTKAQTPGKMAVGISVRRADRPGPLDLATSIRRRLLSLVQIVPVVGNIYIVVFLLDYLWPLWDDKRQALHDKIAQTQVVEGKQPPKQS